jgi:lipid II:glycine glycyltransferase (peptidoglycan interpeptide bridge formation enzyme)
LGKNDIGRLYGLYLQDGTILSIAYMLEHEQRSFYMLGASSALGYQTAASVRLFWELAQRYAEASIEWLNLGGVPRSAASESHEEHGVYRFKSAYGIEPVVRQTLIF